MAEMLGFTAEEMLRGSAFDFIFDQDSAAMYGLFERRRSGAADKMELRLRRKDGSELWTFCHATPILDDRGEFAGALGMFADITGRKHAEDMLRASERRLRLALQSAKMMAWSWDPSRDKIITIGNVREIYGISAIELGEQGFAIQALFWTPRSASSRRRSGLICFAASKRRGGWPRGQTA